MSSLNETAPNQWANFRPGIAALWDRPRRERIAEDLPGKGDLKGAKGKGKGKGKTHDPDRHLLPIELPLTALGHLVTLGHPAAEYMEYRRLKGIHALLTTRWPLIQGGYNAEALEAWSDAMDLMDIDAAACEDLALLASQGVAGRTQANEIVWKGLSNLALEPGHRDFSRKISNLVTLARRLIDRPPTWHEDARSWSWERALRPRTLEFAPTSVPRDPRVVTGPRGRPLRPPACWGAPPPPPPPEGAERTRASRWGR